MGTAVRIAIAEPMRVTHTAAMAFNYTASTDIPDSRYAEITSPITYNFNYLFFFQSQLDYINQEYLYDCLAQSLIEVGRYPLC